MKLNSGKFPHIFHISPRGWLESTPCLVSPEGNTAFLGVVSLLSKHAQGLVSPVIMNQLVALHASAHNAQSIESVEKSLLDWQRANGDNTAPKLPSNLAGVSLRHNAEALWLATEIPDVELPEILKTTQVIE